MKILEEIEKRAAAATENMSDMENSECSYLGETLILLIDTYYNSDKDVDFLNHARTDVPKLCKALWFCLEEMNFNDSPLKRTWGKKIEKILRGEQ